MGLWLHALGLRTPVANAYSDETGVFKNKLGFTNAEQLAKFEYEAASVRTDEILSGKVVIEVFGYGLERQAAIHKHLFQDVYEWAGKIRTIPSAKRLINGMTSRFTEPEAIEQDWKILENKTAEFIATQGMSFNQKCNALTEIFVDANRIHAFPEGNGRSLQVFMKDLAKVGGVELDYTKVGSQEWNWASALSGTYGRYFEHTQFIVSPSNPVPIREIFARIACVALGQNSAFKT